MKSKSTAAILAFFLGGIGVHQFYLGNSKRGILYLLFFWTFIPAILAFIDFIMLLTMNDNVFNLKYNTTMVPQQFQQPQVIVNVGNTFQTEKVEAEPVKQEAIAVV